MNRLAKITVTGYRSIRELRDFELGPITVLVGANGAGKSNLIGFVQMLNYAMTGALQLFVQRRGGAASLLHFGPKRTTQMEGRFEIEAAGGANRYSFLLQFAEPDRLIFNREQVEFARPGAPRPFRGDLRPLAESTLSQPLRPHQRTEKAIKSFLDGCKFFQFHDTTAESPMRVSCAASQNLFLRSDAGNLAAVLLRLREQHTELYRRILGTVQSVAPFVQEFVLQPMAPNGEGLLLRWRSSHDAEYIFGPHQISDGTLRFIALAVLFHLPEEMAPDVVFVDEPELGLHPVAENLLAEMIRAVSGRIQVVLSTQSSSLVDYFLPEEVVVVELDETGASSFRRHSRAELGKWLDRYRLGEAWRKGVLGGRP